MRKPMALLLSAKKPLASPSSSSINANGCTPYRLTPSCNRNHNAHRKHLHGITLSAKVFA